MDTRQGESGFHSFSNNHDNHAGHPGDSKSNPSKHAYDNSSFPPKSSSSNHRNATMDNNAQQDGMIKSIEWKWKDGEESDDNQNEESKLIAESPNPGNEASGDKDSNCVNSKLTSADKVFSNAERTQISDTSLDSKVIGLNASHILKSEEMETQSPDNEMRDEKIQMLRLHHLAKTLMKGECVPSFRNVNDPIQEVLISIMEGEVMDYSRDQTPIGSVYNISHHLTIVDESFLHNSELSLGSYKERKNRFGGTMQNLHEHDSFLNLTSSENKLGKVLHKALIYLKDDLSFGSLAALNSIAIYEAERDYLADPKKHIYPVKSRNHTKNVLALSVSISLVFIALGSVRNLQSSINHEGGIGVISMAISFIGYMVGSIVSPTIVQVIQPKKCIIGGLIPHFIYVASNICPTIWLLGISSLFQGVSLAIVWNAMSTYITLLSSGQARKTGKDYSEISSRYFGIFGLFFQSYFIVGNVIASLVLTQDKKADISSDSSRDSSSILINASTAMTVTQSLTNRSESTMFPSHVTTNKTESYLHLCGANFWQHYDLGGEAYHVSIQTKYILFGTYMGCVLASILIALIILEPLNSHIFQRSVNKSQQLKKQLHALLKIWMTPRFLIITPLLMYSFMEVGFVTAEVTKVS